MRLNPAAVPAILLAALLYWIGVALERRFVSRNSKAWLSIVSFLLALPGLLFALYYTHLFDNATWFYLFMVLEYFEVTISVGGLLAVTLFSWFSPETFGERLVNPGVLLALLTVQFVKPALDTIDLVRLRDHCDSDVCMQSTFSTC